MKTFEIERLMMVALVACLPIACGSSSPTGLDAAALDAAYTASAPRSAPGLPPTVPEAPGPSTLPEPGPSNQAPVPAEGDPTDVPPPDANTGPRPGPNTGPRPDDTQTSPAPSPAPPVLPPNAPPVIVPPPPPQPQPGPGDNRACLAVSAEILNRSASLPVLRANSAFLEIVMLGADGDPIKNDSCRGVAWSFEVNPAGAGFASGALITVSADTRFATVDGLAGAYVIRATTPNGQTDTVAITLQ